MGFFGRGRERELERKPRYAKEDGAALELRLERAELKTEVYRADLNAAEARIRELDPPPPTTEEIARTVVDKYLSGKLADFDRAKFAFSVLLSDPHNPNQGSTPIRPLC